LRRRARAAVAKLAELDTVIGSLLGRRIWENKSQSTEYGIDEIASLYCSSDRGFTYVDAACETRSSTGRSTVSARAPRTASSR
jgi:hypothetical protein